MPICLHLKSQREPSLVVHTLSPSTREAEAGGSLNLRTAYTSPEQVPGQPGLHRETFWSIPLED